MNVSRSLAVLITVALSLFAVTGARAQKQQPIQQFGKLIHPPAPTAGAPGRAGAGPLLSRSSAATPESRVQRNITHHQREIARRGPGAKNVISLPAAVRTPAGVAATGSIAGTIYQSDGVTPAEYGSVTAYNQFGLYAGSCYFGFGDGGAYSIPNLPSASYYLQLTIFSGTYVQEYYNGVTDWRNATLVTVTDGAASTGINFVVKTHSGGITGRVCSAEGVPLPGCTVSASDLDQNIIAGVEVDSAGYFTMVGLPAGEYRVQASSYGDDNYVPQWYGGATIFSEASAVHVTEPGVTAGVNFFLVQGGAIAGKVAAGEGDSISAATCSLSALDADGNEVGYAQNQSGGVFFIPRVPSGTYVISLDYYGTGNYTGGWFDGAADAVHATPVHVLAPDTARITFTLQRGGAIAGVISYGQVNGIAVIAWNEQKEQVSTAYGDETGRFLIAGLPVGRYRILASAVSSPYFSAGQAIDQWYPDAADFAHALPVEVRASDTTSGINFTLLPGGTIFGSVLDPNGAPIVGGSVSLCDVRGAQIRSVSVNSLGGYQIGGLPSGQYKLYYGSNVRLGYPSEWYDGQASCQSAAVVDVAAASYTGSMDFHVKTAASLNGYVADNAGARLSSDDHEVELMLYEGDSGNYVGGLTQSFNGGFQANLLPGKYKVGFFNVSWNTGKPRDSLAVVYYPNGRSFADTSTGSLTLASGSTAALNDCRMERTASAITGTVFDKGTGKPMTSGLFALFAFDEKGYPAALSGYVSSHGPISGSYRITGLRPGRYYLLALAGTQDAGYTLTQWYGNIDVPLDSVLRVPMPRVPPGAVTVTVGQGATSGVDFQLGVTTAIAQPSNPAVPQGYRLEQNYPNPFNPSTLIRYQVPAAVRVTLVVFDMLGREVATLENGVHQAGTYTVTFNGSGLASGVYLYRLRAGNFVESKKLLLIR